MKPDEKYHLMNDLIKICKKSRLTYQQQTLDPYHREILRMIALLSKQINLHMYKQNNNISYGLTKKIIKSKAELID